MTKEEKQKLNEKELYKLFNKGDIDAREFDELRKALPSYEQKKLNAILLSKKKAEIKEEYRKGELSTPDTIAYETLRVLDRNRQNTSTIVTIIAINLVFMIISAIAIVIASN
jgi:hypothetical protein